MSRVERKKSNQISESKLGRKMFCILLIFFILFMGILKVDDSFRSMMLVEGPRVFQYQRLSEDTHQFYFCGESLLVDEKKIKETYGYLKNELEVFLEILKNQKDQFVKNDG